MRTGVVAGAFALALTAAAAAALEPDPAVWDTVLSARSRQGGFDYRGMTGQDRKRLAAYLANLGDADPKTMSDDERKAFFLNAYNAMAVAIVLDAYPVGSIRDIDGAFKGIRRRVGGQPRTLDDIEKELRGMKDARIHFAIVSAAKSCPALAPQAYRKEGLSAALDQRARAFVSDPSKNVFDRAASRVALSKVFDWNRQEFERDGRTLAHYAARFVAEPALADWVATFPREPEFLDFDWALNQP
jgi:hypothetical protein